MRVDLILGGTTVLALVYPHAEDRPLDLFSSAIVPEFTPHARGSTVGKENQRWMTRVYPACAGIDHRSIISPKT